MIAEWKSISAFLCGISVGYTLLSIYIDPARFRPVNCYVFNDKTQLWDRMRQP